MSGPRVSRCRAFAGRFVGEGFIPPAEVRGDRNRPGGYGIRPYSRGRRPRRPVDVRGGGNIPGGMNPSPTVFPVTTVTLRTGVHGCSVGSGLDRSVPAPTHSPVNGS